jgi:hypothetical protein
MGGKRTSRPIKARILSFRSAVATGDLTLRSTCSGIFIESINRLGFLNECRLQHHRTRIGGWDDPKWGLPFWLLSPLQLRFGRAERYVETASTRVSGRVEERGGTRAKYGGPADNRMRA